tara:strand:+ start:741 stop:1499 length:759 start_codon:yes stop_codon:yes gene_type:complete
MFKGTSITKANPADFSFETHLTTEKDEQIVLELLTDLVTTSGNEQLKSFDLFVVSTNGTFKITGCVITQGEFSLEQSNHLILRVSGQGQKLERVGNESFSLPGSLQSASATRTPTKPLLDVLVSDSAVSNLVAATLLVQNNIQWTPYETLQNSLSVTNATNAMYPSDYSLVDRNVSGNITQFHTDANASEYQTFNTSTSVKIRTKVNGSIFFNANLTDCMYTKRSEPTEVFTQTYDFRLVGTPNDLGNQITY